MFSLFPSRAVALQVGPLAVHWYGVMYLLAFLVVWWWVPLLEKHRRLKLSKDDVATLLTYGVLGTIIGGRLGYILLYAPALLRHPFEAIAIWHGGMASHGGFVGVAIALLLFCRKFKIPFLALCDVLVVPVAIGLALGRLGNFINEELYGTVTSLSWCMEFTGVEGCRHPTQIYAIFKDLLIAGICFLHLGRDARCEMRNANAPHPNPNPNPTGTTFALFLLLYGLLRFLVEFFRSQTVPPIWIGLMWLTYGQLLTIPILLAGIAIYAYRRLA